MLDFLSYASFHFRYSTKLFLHFHVRFIKIINVDKITNAFVNFFVNVANVYNIYGLGPLQLLRPRYRGKIDCIYQVHDAGDSEPT